MYQISDKQIDYIFNDISARGVEMESLQQNLVDHVCCIIEQNLETNGDFEDFYQKTIKTFYKDALWEIEEETLLLLTFKNYYTMKKIMIRSGAVSAITMTVGIFFKFMHWPGAAALIILGIFISSFVFIPLLFTLKAKEKQNAKDKLILGLATFSGILISLAVLFKVMHWPGANVMGITFVCVMVLLYIPLYFLSGIKNPDTKVNTIVTSVFLIMGCGLFLTLVNSRPYIQIDANHCSEQAQQDSYVRTSEKVNNLYVSLKDSSSSKVEGLVKNCDTLCDKIEAMKLQLLSNAEGIKVNKINYYELGQYLDNYDIPTHLLFSHVEKHLASQELSTLKEDLQKLKNRLSTDFKMAATDLIDLSDKRNQRTGNMDSWEVANFYKTPLQNVLRNFTQLQLNIRVIELTCMN